MSQTADLERTIAELRAELVAKARVESDLRKSEACYRTFLDLSSEDIWRCDFDPPIPVDLSVEAQASTIVYRGYQTFTNLHRGYQAFTNEQMARAEGNIAIPGLIRSQLAAREADLQLAIATVAVWIQNGYQAVDMEMYDHQPDGSVQCSLNNIIGVVENGFLMYTLASRRDITPLKQAEQAALRGSAQLAYANAELVRRDTLLQGVAEAAYLLLNTADTDEAVKSALQIIGERLSADRIVVAEHIADETGESQGYLELLYEWHMPHIASQLKHHKRLRYEDEDWYDLLMQGQTLGTVILDSPEPFRSSQQALGVQSAYTVPIIVDGQYWGIVGLDDCREVTQREPVELTLLQTAATCIVSAIQQKQMRQARDKAEQERQDTLLHERTRMAGEIHDTLAQAFTGVIVQLAAAERVLSAEASAAQHHLARASDLARSGLADARRSVWALLPDTLYNSNLSTSISGFVEQMTRYGMTVATVTVHGHLPLLTPVAEMNLLRIAQEAITNALRHAQPSRILIDLIEQDGTMQLRVTDNGQGFDPRQKQRGYGLLSMYERAASIGATLTITSAPQQGTTVLVALPVETIA